MADISHKVKTSLAVIGAGSSRDDIEVIESNARASTNLDEIETKCSSLKILCRRLIMRLEELRIELMQKL